MNDETIEPEFRSVIERLVDAFDDAHLEPIPSRLSAAALDAYSWRRADAELAELLFDSASDALVGVRGTTTDRRSFRYAFGRLRDQGPPHRRVVERHDRTAALGDVHRRQCARERTASHRRAGRARGRCPGTAAAARDRAAERQGRHALDHRLRDHGLTDRKMAGGTGYDQKRPPGQRRPGRPLPVAFRPEWV